MFKRSSTNQRHHRHLRWRLGAILLALVFCAAGGSAQARVIAPTPIALRYIGTTSLESLIAGAPGRGTLLYYLPERGSEHPSLVVRLSKAAGASVALAEVFDAPSGQIEVPVQITDTEVTITTDSRPAITISALDGWWAHDGRRSFNLDIQISGPIVAMWGTNYDSKNGPYGWITAVQPGQPAVAIQVRDPRSEGLPLWDLRLLIPEFPGRGYYRTNYAERRCATPTALLPGVSPQWPFVAAEGTFEQTIGTLMPPIVVDWARGRISHFSELVSVRHQNCSYAAYSIAPLAPGALNQADFETPFAFYDLSGQGRGYPNLILRAERFPASDPWSANLDGTAQRGHPVPHEFATIRYSWRNDIGDQTWDYKIEALGSNPYIFTTPIAGGWAMIDAPAYDQFPAWVIKHDWPAVTFIATEGHSYPSSEGIYEWSPLEAGVGYLIGWDNQPKPNAFADISTGFRGEYRLRHDQPPLLYVSPIDNRLHLLGAEGGLWKLDSTHVLRVAALGDGNYINSWVRQNMVMPATDPGAIEEQLYAFDGYILYANQDTVQLRQTIYQPALFETAPPIDRASWQAAREQLAPYTRQQSDPRDLRSWLDQFSGPMLSVTGGRISSVRVTTDGFRFVLRLQPSFTIPSGSLLDPQALTAGDYLVSYDGTLAVTRLADSLPVARLADGTLTQLKPGALQVTVSNTGLWDISDATIELWATPPGSPATLAVTKTITLPAQATLTTTLDWAAPQAGEWLITPRIRQPAGQTLAFPPAQVRVLPVLATLPGLIDASTNLIAGWLLVGGLIMLAALVARISWLQLGYLKGSD